MIQCEPHELVTRKLDWDDKIPYDLRHIWKSHFKGMPPPRAVLFAATFNTHTGETVKRSLKT